MSPAELAAYIGAAAWLPYAAGWLYRAAAKPKLSVMPAPTIDLRYDERGPVARLTFSLSAERRDVIIEAIDLHVRHEQGDERVLSWMFMGDLSEEPVIPVTAIKVTTATLVDRKITFQDVAFSGELRRRKDDIIAQFNFLRTNESDPLEALRKSKEMHSAKEHFADGCYWKPGKYTFEVRLRARGAVHRDTFEVLLSKLDVDSLRQSCDLFSDYITAAVMGSIGTPAVSPAWRWVTTAINRQQ